MAILLNLPNKYLKFNLFFGGGGVNLDRTNSATSNSEGSRLEASAS